MTKLKTDIQLLQQITYEAYLATGGILALAENDITSEERNPLLAQELDKVAGKFEGGAVVVRKICETYRPNLYPAIKKPFISPMTLTGNITVNEYGWVHIELHTLLPHCRFQTPVFLVDTLIRLMDEYESHNHILPHFEHAMLIIDEHCNIESRRVFDQDNKGWKAIPNAIKGRLIDDDDQFTLDVALISTKSDIPSCNIYLIHADEAGDFFALRSGDFPGLFH